MCSPPTATASAHTSQGQLFRQGSAINTVGLQAVKVNSYEVGVRGRIARRVDYDVAAYSMIKTDDILSYTFPDGHTEAQNAGQTTHRGIETSLGVAVTTGLRLDVAYSYAKHMYADWQTTANVDLSGKEIVQAPRSMGTAGLTFAPPRWNGARLGLDVELDSAADPGKSGQHAQVSRIYPCTTCVPAPHRSAASWCRRV